MKRYNINNEVFSYFIERTSFVFYKNQINMAVLNITRNDQYVDRLRDYKIYINNKYIASIGNRKTISITIDEGTNKIQAKIDSLWKSNEITIKMNNEIEYNVYVENPIKGYKIIFYLFYLFFPKKYIKLQVQSDR